MENVNRKNTLSWIAITMTLFAILIVVGVFMRTIQAGGLTFAQGWFYPMMTLHGVGMVGIWFVSAMACAERVLSRYVEPKSIISRLSIAGTVLGVVFLLISVFVGKFAAGWYFLYPLPLNNAWPRWAAVVFLLSLTILGAVWLIWCLDLLRAIAQKYSLSKALGWHYLMGKNEPEVPPAVIITTVSLIAAIACLFSAVVVLLLFYNEMLSGVPNDALLMKNLTFFFGHVLVNISLYLAVSVVYDVMPEYCDRPWKSNKIVAISWNSVLAIVLMAYFHHLYMDFVQPQTFQFIGQVMSYLSSLPAAVVTIFGALALVYRAKVRWNLTSGLMFLGLMGWAIGGIGAVIDSTIMVNMKFHNTLWVPAHFHTYMIEGLVLMVLGYYYHYCHINAAITENSGLQKATIGMLVIGGFGFLMMFYIAGAQSIPRRYAVYPADLTRGALYSTIALFFISIFILGMVAYLYETGRRWFKAIGR